MRTVSVTPPSFPEDAPVNRLLTPAGGERWQVLCGDGGNWRLGIYSPPEAQLDEIKELETHDCPELFFLMGGALTLVLWEHGALRELPLEPNRPVLVTAPHGGYCPNGSHSGRALVVERDQFTTHYHTLGELAAADR